MYEVRGTIWEESALRAGIWKMRTKERKNKGAQHEASLSIVRIPSS